MAWSLFGEKQAICLTAPFSEKYTLTIETDIMAGNMPIQSTAEIRWQVNVSNVAQNTVDISITTLHNQLLFCNNPMVKELAVLSQVFSKMYSEIELTIDHTAKIISIKNIDLIRKKWDWIKEEMQSIVNTDDKLRDVIKLNDELFADPAKVLIAIQNNEFFMFYFNHFWGQPLPTTLGSFEKATLLNTTTLKWKYYTQILKSEYTKKPDENKTVKLEGLPDTRIDKEWIKNAYAAFSHLPINELQPEFKDNALYTIAPSGKVVQATIDKSEIVHPTLLFAKYKYTLTLDEHNKLNPMKPDTNTTGDRVPSLIVE